MLCAAVNACKKVSGPANGKSIQQNNKLDSLVFMGASINGVTWNADSAFAYSVKSSGNDSAMRNILINAVSTANGNNSTIQFNIYNYSGAAKYGVNPPLVTATYYIGTQRHFANYGYVDITSDTAHAMIGNFYFSADSFNINGSFNVATP